MLHHASPSALIDQVSPVLAHALLGDDPAEIREQAAQRVATGQTAEAFRLVEQGLQRHPRSEHLLAMRALLCEMRQDWPQADHTLELLLNVQGARAPAESWAHWVRVLRCRGHLVRAWNATLHGLHWHPEDAVLQSEHGTLQAMARAGEFECPAPEQTPSSQRRRHA